MIYAKNYINAGHALKLFCFDLVRLALAHIFHFNDVICPVPAK